MAEQAGKTAPTAPPTTLPPFDASQPRKQHPLYSTTASVYGSKAPSEHEKIVTSYGQKGEFTKTASQRAPAGTSFVTSIDKPRVHKDVAPS